MKHPAPTTADYTLETIAAGRIRLTLNWSNHQLAEIGLGWNSDRDTQDAQALSSTGQAVLSALRTYAAGKPVTWPDLPLPLETCTPFAREVLTRLRAVPAGTTVTYGELAAMAGRPGAARGVGQVMRRNRWPLIIPCHRVVGSNGAMTGFSGIGGIPLKEYLLELERSAARP